MDIAEGIFCDQSASVYSHAAEAFCYPGRIPAKQFVVFRGTQMTYKTQLDNKLVNQLLGSSLVQDACLQIALDIDIKERCCTSKACGCSVVLLDTCQICHVQILNRFTGIFSRLCDIASIPRCHIGHFLESADLFADIFQKTDSFICHGTVKQFDVLFF